MAKTHPSHQMRGSDSSYYDEICNNCGEPDWCTSDNLKLSLQCEAVVVEEKIDEDKIVDSNLICEKDFDSKKQIFEKLKNADSDRGVYITARSVSQLVEFIEGAYADGFNAALDSVNSIQVSGSMNIEPSKKMIADILQASLDILRKPK